MLSMLITIIIIIIVMIIITAIIIMSKSLETKLTSESKQKG